MNGGLVVNVEGLRRDVDGGEAVVEEAAVQGDGAEPRREHYIMRCLLGRDGIN